MILLAAVPAFHCGMTVAQDQDDTSNQEPPLASAHVGEVKHPAEAWKAGMGELIDPQGIAGTLVIIGGGKVPEIAKEVLANHLKKDDSFVVITAASAERESAGKSAAAMLSASGIANVVIAPEIDDASTECETLSGLLEKAGGVWICGGQQSRLAERYGQTNVETQLVALLNRGGIVAGTSAGAAIMSKVMIASGREKPELKQGFDLLPGAIVDQHFSQRERLSRSQFAVAENPGYVGIGIDESTALIVRGRTMRVLGSGSVTFLLGPCNFRDAEATKVVAGDVVDWVQLRRAAKERLIDVDPGQPQFGPPNVSSGSLVIVGGGGLPNEIAQKFIELAGGKQAHLIVLPTAVPRKMAEQSPVPGFLANARVASITQLPQMGPSDVSEPEFREALERATGVWFGGGRQWNFVDAYDGSEAVKLFHQVLERGGVIGGSSAGATIQGEFLVRGHPLGNTVMMAEGYQRGFAFLPGVAIDQHFSQRRRQSDLIPVVKRHPGLLGIGIDEATALVVKGSKAEVLGKHAVHFFGHRQFDSGEYVTVKSGDAIDLQELVLPLP